MRNATSLILTYIIFLILTEPVASFGAGFIPNYAYLNGEHKAFRHGDIEEILPGLVKTLGSSLDLNSGGGWFAFVASLFSFGSGTKFTKMDMKRIYFGNWLRDYSQAMDIGGLSQITAHTLLMVVSVFGFMTFGFSTAEFEVTPERLGVYLPVEHIDNPKGYGEKEGDARQIHPNLRPPVDPQELEVNPSNGMKNYIATEGFSWDTSSAHIRRTLEQCIALGRKAHGKENEDLWEAFRLLGSALHTLEDLLAHSNWCELALRKLGHPEVFCHVGDDVLIDTPGGPAPPLVTGTFGSADFMYSVLGEAMDRLSEASMSSLTGTINEVKSRGESHLTIIRSLLSRLSILGDTAHSDKMEQAESIKQKAYDFNPDDVAPEEIQRFLWHILEWRDTFYKDIVMGIDKIPGLSALLEEITNTLDAFILTLLEPVFKPILQDAMDALQESSTEVIDSANQYEVFNDPHASDPTHSILAKDHFGLLLNEPAGKIARAVVEYTVNLIVKAWHEENDDVKAVIDQILEVLHHPYFATISSEVQCRMMDHLKQWVSGLKPPNLEKTIQALTKESVREGRNKRLVAEEEAELPRSSGEEQVVETQELDGQEQSGNNNISGEETRTEERGIYYKIRPGVPIYSRFDGLLRPQEVEMDWKRRYYTEKSDEEFWRNPYTRRYSLAPSQDYPAGGFRKPLRPVYPSYPGRREYTTSTDVNPCAPSGALAEAEAGYLSVLNQNRERYDSMGWRRANAIDMEYGDSYEKRGYDSSRFAPFNAIDREYGDSYEKRGYGSSRFAPSTYGYSKNGKAPDYTMQPEEGLYGQPPRPTVSVSRRYDPTTDRRSGGGTYRNVDDGEGPPAFFVRTSYAEGPYNDTGAYMAESPYDSKDYYGGGGGGVTDGKFEAEEAYDEFGAEKSRRKEKSRSYTLPEYEPFGSE